jgi:hypothetical protein
MITRPKMEDYAFPKSENDYEQLGFYTDYLEEYCDALEKALDKACEYTHDCGSNGCPFNYCWTTITNEKMNECNICDYQCMSSDDRLNNEYLKKSIKCWKEYFLRGDTENDEN